MITWYTLFCIESNEELETTFLVTTTGEAVQCKINASICI